MSTFTYTAIQSPPEADLRAAPPRATRRPNTKRGFWLVVSLAPEAEELVLESWHDSKRLAEQQAGKLSARYIHSEYIVLRPQSHFSAVINVSKGRFW